MFVHVNLDLWPQTIYNLSTGTSEPNLVNFHRRREKRGRQTSWKHNVRAWGITKTPTYVLGVFFRAPGCIADFVSPWVLKGHFHSGPVLALQRSLTYTCLKSACVLVERGAAMSRKQLHVSLLNKWNKYWIISRAAKNYSCQRTSWRGAQNNRLFTTRVNTETSSRLRGRQQQGFQWCFDRVRCFYQHLSEAFERIILQHSSCNKLESSLKMNMLPAAKTQSTAPAAPQWHVNS